MEAICMDRRTGQESDAAKAVLVVEDDRVARLALEDIFDLMGYRALIAQDGAQALDLYARHAGEIGLVLSDLSMPKMNGIELAQHLNAINPQIKIVLATGYASEDQRQASHTAKISGWLQKPYSMDALALMIDQHFDG